MSQKFPGRFLFVGWLAGASDGEVRLGSMLRSETVLSRSRLALLANITFTSSSCKNGPIFGAALRTQVFGVKLCKKGVKTHGMFRKTEDNDQTKSNFHVA
ncbi:hypothetical protein TNCV_2440251 [Trichonephila clavipes]|nr:hypothetical protein TNCV_2440251 [Trichonephila clavipes]